MANPEETTNPLKKGFRGISFLNKIKVRDVVVMTRQFSVMIDAGLPITRSLDVLIKQTENKKLAIVLEEVSAKVQAGSSLSSAFKQYPEVFSQFYVSLIASGETGGNLADSLRQLADQVEKNHELTSSIRSALVYPAFIVSVIVVVGIVLLIYVVPQLQSVFEESGVQLPLFTRMLIGVSNFLVSFWWIIIIVIAAIWYGFYRWLKTVNGRVTWDGFKLRIPIIGKILRKIYVARFTRTLGSLVEGQLPIIESITVASDVVNNEIYKSILMQTAERVKAGDTIIAALSEHSEIQPLVTQLIGVGEETGQLGFVLTKVADFFKEEVDRAVKNLTNLLEPAIIVLLAVAVAGVVLSIIQPIYNLTSAI
ncbi:type II secretion system F family protein [Patescibacteria group bacterium]